MGLYMLGTKLSAWKKDSTLTAAFQMRKGDSAEAESGFAADRKRMSWENAKAFADYVLQSNEAEQVSQLVVEFSGVDDYEEIDLMDRISDYFTDKMARRSQRLWFRFRSGWEAFQLMEIWRYLQKHERNIEVELILNSFQDIKDGIIYLWEKGVAEVFVHMEPEEEETEERIFEQQLKELADYALDNQLFRRCRCNFFEEEIAGCLWKESENAGGGFESRGMMVDPVGDIYGFIREFGSCFERKEKWLAGDLKAGVDPERMRPFCAILTSKRNCEEEKLCLARIRANEYYFAQLWARYRIRRQKRPKLQRMFIPLAEQSFSLRCQREGEYSKRILSDEMLEKALNYCEKNGVEAVLVHPEDELLKIEKPQLYRIRSVHIVPEIFCKEAAARYENVISVSGKDISEAESGTCSEEEFKAEKEEFAALEALDLLLEKAGRDEMGAFDKV